jgi:hypothetical protein
MVRLLVSPEIFRVTEATFTLSTSVSACQGRLVRLLVFCAFARSVEQFAARWIATREAIVYSLDSLAFLRDGLEWPDLVVLQARDELALLDEHLIDAGEGHVLVLEDDHSSEFAVRAQTGVPESHHLRGCVHEATLSAREQLCRQRRLIWCEHKVVYPVSNVDVELASILRSGP